MWISAYYLLKLLYSSFSFNEQVGGTDYRTHLHHPLQLDLSNRALSTSGGSGYAWRGGGEQKASAHRDTQQNPGLVKFGNEQHCCRSQQNKPLAHQHMMGPALVGWEGEEDHSQMPSLSYPKSSFPVIMGDVAETEETSEFIISPEEMGKEKHSSTLQL